MMCKQCLLLICAVLFGTAIANADNYQGHPLADQFIDDMVVKHGFDRDYLQSLMTAATRNQSILDAIARPAEKTKEWWEYRDIFVTATRTRQGKAFLEQYHDTLIRAEQNYGVPKEIIAAIIGVETRYGRHKGSYRVLDALATLGFDYPPRAKFFRRQLEEYLVLVREQGFDATVVKGSYAGAMGYGQFIPSSYRHYAVDFDGDGVVDIINNPVDAIGSVANYFKRHGWRPGQPVTSRATVSDNVDLSVLNQGLKPKYSIAELKSKGYFPVASIDGEERAIAIKFLGDKGEEFWLGLHNFYVISRYNRSSMYSMAVYQLSQEFH